MFYHSFSFLPSRGGVNRFLKRNAGNGICNVSNGRRGIFNDTLPGKIECSCTGYFAAGGAIEKKETVN